MGLGEIGLATLPLVASATVAAFGEATVGSLITAWLVGVSATDYAQQVYGVAGGADRYAATGTSAAVISNRLSYFLDARGPSLTIDTACSASLVAVV